jgi:hypothetical protein
MPTGVGGCALGQYNAELASGVAEEADQHRGRNSSLPPVVVGARVTAGAGSYGEGAARWSLNRWRSTSMSAPGSFSKRGDQRGLVGVVDGVWLCRSDDIFSF